MKLLKITLLACCLAVAGPISPTWSADEPTVKTGAADV